MLGRLSMHHALLCLALLAGCHQMGHASTAEIDARHLLERVADRYARIESYYIEGTLSMVLELQGMRQAMEMGITFAGAGPDRRRIEFRHPLIGVLSVTNGDSTWTYSEQLNQYARSAMVPVSAPEEGEPKRLGGSPGAVGDPLKAFIAIGSKVEKVTLLGEDEIGAGKDRVQCLMLEVFYPPGSDSVDGVSSPDTLWIDPKRELVLRTHQTIAQTSRGATIKVNQRLNFTVVRTNTAVPDSLFQFVPPEGAREVEDLAFGDAPPDLTGSTAPLFKAEDLRRKTFGLERLRGNVVLLDFWASWCGPCRAELPTIEKLHREFGAKGLVVLGVNSESRDIAEAFMRKNKYTFPSLVDSDEDIARKYQIRGIPTVIVIDRGGTIVSHLVGLRGESELREALSKGGLD